jgi:hypothetical protein
MDFIPGGSGHVLITSRNRRWQDVVAALAVDEFSRAESVTFLTRRIPLAISENDAKQLARELGDLPLALEQAGSLLADRGMSITQYMQLLEKQPADLLAEGQASAYPLSMTAAWKLSVSMLNQWLPQAMDLLRCCAFFGKEPIPLDIFEHAALVTESHLSGLLADPFMLPRAIEQFGRFGLARTNPGRGTIQVHRLTRALLCDDLSQEEQDQFRHEAHLLLAGTVRGDPEDPSMWSRCAELVPHITAARVAECQNPQVRSFALGMVHYLYQSGDHELARALMEQFLEHWTVDSGHDHPDVVAAQRHLEDILRK